MSEVPIEGKIVGPNTTRIVWVPDLENPEAPTAAELAGGIKLEGVVADYSFTAPHDGLYSGTNYSAQMSFERDHAFTRKQMVEMFEALRIKPTAWQTRVLGQWEYTPREELKDRLNAWLRGDYPGEPINWKGLK